MPPFYRLNSLRYFNYRSRYRRSTFIRRRVRGPYAVMAFGNRHTHPVYPRPELKFVDYFDPFPIPLGPAFIGPVCWNALTQGLGGSGRIGRSVSIKSFAYNLSIALFPTAQGPINVRVMFIWDKQANGVAPSATDILTTATITSFLNLANKERFTVLRNHFYSLSPNGTSIVNVSGFVRINMQSQYNDSNDIPRTGAIWGLYVTDSDDVDNDPFVYLYGRCRYYDN